jgi:mannosyltransferase
MDEAWTLFSVRLSLAELVQMSQTYEASKAVYYGIAGMWAQMLGSALENLRAFSVVWMVLAAAGVITLGLRLAGPRVAALAGILFALLPTIAWYGTEARPYALVVALATWSSVALVEAQSHSWAGAWRWIYVALLTGLVLVQVLALALVLAHVVTLVVARAQRSDLSRLGISVAFAMLISSPVVLAVVVQNGVNDVVAVAPRGAQFYLDTLAGIVSPLVSMMSLSLAALISALALRGASQSRNAHLSATSLSLVSVTAPWVALPVGLYLLISIVSWQAFPRHVIVVLPALTLLAAAGLVGLSHRKARIGLFATVVGLAVVLQAQLHDAPDGDGWAAKRAVLLQNARPGDGLLAQDHVYAMLPTADPVPDVSLLQDMTDLIVRAESLAMFEADVRARLSARDRVWLVRYDERPANNTDEFTQWLESAGLELVRTFPGGNVPLELWARDGQE